MTDQQPNTPLKTEQPASPQTGSNSTPTPTTGQKVRDAAYMVKCSLVGGFFTIAGIALIFNGSGSPVGGLLVAAYGIWVLSGLITGGWRLLIY